MKVKNVLKELILVTFVVFAFSCGSSDDGGTGEVLGFTDGTNGSTETSITISSDKDVLFTRDFVIFFVTNNNNTGVTSASTIYVDGTAISGTRYAFTDAGVHTIYAKKGDLQSPEITVEAVESTHTTKVMVEDYTGTWCQYCPRIAGALEDVVNQDSNIIPVAIHDDNDMLFPYAIQMESTFGVNGFPTARINRTNNWGTESYNELTSYLDSRQNMGLAINSSLSGNTITAEVKVHYDLKVDSENKLVVYLLENGLIYPQVNFYNGDPSSQWYQQGNPIQNFVHDHTAREVFTDVFGDVIPSSETTTDNTYTANLNMTLPSSVQNSANLEIVAFVVGANKEVLNVQKANLGEDKDFD